MLSKKHGRSSTVQEEGLKNEGRHHLLLLHKQALDKKGIVESLHGYMTWNIQSAHACEVGGFWKVGVLSQLSKMHPPPSLRSHLNSLPMGVFSSNIMVSQYVCGE